MKSNGSKTTVATETFWQVRLRDEKVVSDGISFRGTFETTSAPENDKIYVPQIALDVLLTEADVTPMERITVTTVITREV